MFNNLINFFREKISRYITRLYAPIQPDSVYHVGLIVLLLWLFRFSSTKTSILDSFFMWFGVALLIYGFCWEVYRLLFRLWANTPVGSIILAITSSALVVSLSIVLAEHLINEATLTNPAYFPNSRNIIASFATPVILAYFFVFGLLIYYFWLALITSLRPMVRMFMPVFGREPASSENFSVEFSRLIAAPMLAMLLTLSLAGISAGSGSSLQTVIKYIVAIADHYAHVKCTNVSSEERYLMIDANLLSVVSKTSTIDFSQRACNAE